MNADNLLSASLTRVKIAQRNLSEALFQAMKTSGLDIRPMVRKAAVIMEEGLQAHDEERGVRGWADTDPDDMLTFLHDETRKLEEALSDGGPEDVWKAAADVASFAAMIADAFEEQFVGEVHSDANKVLGVTTGLDIDDKSKESD